VKRLLILRHAKAVPGDARTDDHERPLSSRGQGDASLMGAEMHHRLYVPDLALCSTAKRTVETWERVAPEFDSPPKSQFVASLYHAAPKAILKLVQSADDSVESLCIVGHNPGLEEFSAAMVQPPESKSERDNLERMREKFPTGALAVFELGLTRWREIEPATGLFADFIRPKDLKGE
jgi:phosphohistidine phosphatase